MSPDLIDEAVADAADEATQTKATLQLFDKGVAVNVVPLPVIRKDDIEIVIPKASDCTKYKSEGDGAKWERSTWFNRRQMEVLRGFCDEAIVAMDAIEAEQQGKQ